MFQGTDRTKVLEQSTEVIRVQNVNSAVKKQDT